MIHNPYVDLVSQHPRILTEHEKIYAHKGTWATFFDNKNPIVLEIGSWFGNFFARNASLFPDRNFIGMEIIFKRLYKTAQKSEKRKASNFCLIRDKGENIDRIFDTGEIDVSYILFPDPWGKKRYQRKNRLLQKPFLEQLFTITKTGGDFFFRTDHREYFEEVLGIMRTLPWQEHRISFDYAQEPDIYDPTAHTEFEDIWRAEKLPVCYGHWKKSSK